MKEKITWIVITLCIAMLTAIPFMIIISHSSGHKKEDETEIFVEIESHSSYDIVYDKDTRVIYAKSNSGTNTFCPLYNADGTLKTHKEDNT